MNFGIVIKEDNEEAKQFAKEAVDFLKKRGHQIVEKDFKGCDFIVTFGGDGSLIHTACEYADLEIPFVGINTGRLGFLTALEGKDWKKGFEGLIDNRFYVFQRMSLEATIETRDNKQETSYRAVNELVIKGLYRVIDLEIEINGEKFLQVVGDGVIIGSPTGSTAYSLSSGGPIVDPSLDCFLITPINPIGLPIPSVVVSPKDKIRVRIIKGEDVSLIIDGQEHTKLVRGGQAEVVRGKQDIKFVYFDKEHFLKALNAKFGLSERVLGK